MCGFAKSRALSPGESEQVEIELDFHAFGMYEARRRSWVIDKDAEFEILLGTVRFRLGRLGRRERLLGLSRLIVLDRMNRITLKLCTV
jgi:beta-glucosidase